MCSVVLLTICVLCSGMDQFTLTYVWSFFGITLLGIIGLVQVVISGHLKTAHDDCIMKCQIGVLLNANTSSTVSCTNQSSNFQETSFILGIHVQDSPPAYDTIEPTDKCPTYEEVIIQIQNLPEKEKVLDSLTAIDGS